MADRRHLDDETRDENPGAAEQAGEGVGGIGGIAGAVGGWWAGEKAGRAIEDMGDHDDDYRRHHTESGRRDVEYDEARIGYGLGHVAGRNPDYRGRAFSDVENDLRKGWRHDKRDFDSMRPYVEYGYERSSRNVRD